MTQPSDHHNRERKHIQKQKCNKEDAFTRRFHGHAFVSCGIKWTKTLWRSTHYAGYARA